jgi:uncharacterized protein
MAMPGITFTVPQSASVTHDSRADIAMFVGLIGRDAAPIPDKLRRQLAGGGWVPMQRPVAGDSEAHIRLLGLPVAVESWSEFASLYIWDMREVEPGSRVMIPCNLALAVRSFFLEGGRKAYIVRTGDPLPVADFDVTEEEFVAAKRALIDWTAVTAPSDSTARQPLLPGFNNPSHDADPGERATWRGAAAIFGIEDAAMLLLPDLIELCSGLPRPIAERPGPPGPGEQFKDCAPALPAALPEARAARPQWRAPRLDAGGYSLWARGLQHLLELLGRPRGPAHRRDVMLLGAMPLPLAEAGFDHGEERNPLLLLSESGAVAAGQKLFAGSNIGNARLQLCYPWVETQASQSSPEGIESPEGVFAGLLAKKALSHGAFHSAAGQEPTSVRGMLPALSLADLRNASPGQSDWLGERLSIFGTRYGKVNLLSDATAADSRAWRPGGVSRLMGIILRAARQMGQDQMFEPNAPETWSRLRGQMERFLRGLQERGALTSVNGQPAFEVRCDRTTMTQFDLDAGRAIMSIGFTAAYPVERIEVSLALVEPVAMPRREAA